MCRGTAKNRHAAAVDPYADLLLWKVGKFRDVAQNHALHRAVWLIVVALVAQLPLHQNEREVLADAVVVEPAGLFSCRHQLELVVVPHGIAGLHDECVIGDVGLFHDAFDKLHLARPAPQRA